MISYQKLNPVPVLVPYVETLYYGFQHFIPRFLMIAAKPAIAAFSDVMQQYGEEKYILIRAFNNITEIHQLWMPGIFQPFKVPDSKKRMFVNSIAMIHLIDNQVPQFSEFGNKTVKNPHLMHLPQSIINPVAF